MAILPARGIVNLSTKVGQAQKRDGEKGSDVVFKFGAAVKLYTALKHAAPRLRRLRLGLQTRRGSNHSTAHVSESNSRSNVFQISRTSVCVSSRCLHSLLLEMGNQCRKTTLVAHFRGSTLQFCAEPQDLRKSTRVCRVVIGWRPRWRITFSLERFSDPSRICLRAQSLESSLGRVPQAADGSCNKISQIRSCRSPRTV